MGALDDHAIELDNLLEGKAAMTKAEVIVYTHWTPRHFDDVVKHHRRYLSDDRRALIVEQVPDDGSYIYFLTEESTRILQWELVRVRDATERLYTMVCVGETGIKMTDGRALDGKRMRYVVRCVSRVREDLEEVIGA
jgi:hypothetical protein